MNPNNYLLLEFPSHRDNLPVACAAVVGFVSQMDLTMEELNDIKCSVSEAVDNAITHAFPDTPGRIVLTCRLGDSNTLTITVRDTGIGITDVNQARKPLFTTAGPEHSGMGIPIMESFMSNVKIFSIPGKGTVVEMHRQLHPRE